MPENKPSACTLTLINIVLLYYFHRITWSLTDVSVIYLALSSLMIFYKFPSLKQYLGTSVWGILMEITAERALLSPSVCRKWHKMLANCLTARNYIWASLPLMHRQRIARDESPCAFFSLSSFCPVTTNQSCSCIMVRAISNLVFRLFLWC